jgi:tryptophan halogenase
VSDTPVRSVVIVGGGTAGWMTAAALARLIGGAGGVAVRLVESDAIGTVGVGEASIPPIRDYNALIGLDEGEFLRRTGGTYKLGIRFAGWRRPGQDYMHPFGVFGRDTVAVRFQQLWLKLAQDLPGDPADALGAYSAATLAAEAGRFAPPDPDQGHPLSTLNHAYHFDAGLYARLLRERSEAWGVERTEGRVAAVDRDGASGFVRAVTLADGRRIEGDLFVDCSGFASLLLGGALDEPFVDWARWLPCDRALAMPGPALRDPPPFTRATADAAGWRWRIPLQHRTGNGYVFSSDHLDEDGAHRRLIDGGEVDPTAEPRRLRFRAGHRRRLWSGNVVAIGLAGGFLEPLESTSIHLIQTGITRLIRFFPGRDCAEPDRAAYNRLSVLEYEQVRDFLILHYKATDRRDTAFWARCGAMEIPDSLAARIDLFRSRGRLARQGDELFSEDSWFAVMIGQGIAPVGHDPVADRIALPDLRRQMTGLRQALARAVAPLPTHRDALARRGALATGMTGTTGRE